MKQITQIAILAIFIMTGAAGCGKGSPASAQPGSPSGASQNNPPGPAACRGRASAEQLGKLFAENREGLTRSCAVVADRESDCFEQASGLLKRSGYFTDSESVVALAWLGRVGG